MPPRKVRYIPYSRHFLTLEILPEQQFRKTHRPQRRGMSSSALESPLWCHWSRPLILLQRPISQRDSDILHIAAAGLYFLWCSLFFCPFILLFIIINYHDVFFVQDFVCHSVYFRGPYGHVGVISVLALPQLLVRDAAHAQCEVMIGDKVWFDMSICHGSVVFASLMCVLCQVSAVGSKGSGGTGRGGGSRTFNILCFFA